MSVSMMGGSSTSASLIEGSSLSAGDSIMCTSSIASSNTLTGTACGNSVSSNNALDLEKSYQRQLTDMKMKVTSLQNSWIVKS